MFTGIVEGLGIVEKKTRTRTGLRLAVRFEKRHLRLKTGDSVAVNGVCLTAAKIFPAGFEADVIPETLRATTLGRIEPGSQVNLERALRYGSRMGGHVVSGHVDGRGTVTRKVRSGREQILWVRVPAKVRRFCALKGSITLDGVSLTIQDFVRGCVKVALIPHTLKMTTLGWLASGAGVNVEADRPVRRTLNFRPVRENAAQLRRRLKTLAAAGF